MTNAAVFFHPDAFDTSVPALMGRQVAGESFLRGFLRHADVERFYFWNAGDRPAAECEALLRRIAAPPKPVEWLGRNRHDRLAEPGCAFVSAPANAKEAWNRRLLGSTRYSICGLTHTTASDVAMDELVAMLHAPVEPWDALICTSRAVTDAVALQLDMAMAWFRERFGPAVRRPEIRLETIPLGINADDYARSPEHRAAWRTRLGVGDDDIVVLYVGRLSMHAKMNPVPMAMALEKAARRTRRRVHWVLAGWAANDFLHRVFADAGPTFAPSVTTHVLDGRLPEVRLPIWSAGDVFLSLSDNIQETFGLTPVEAMAAGLPSVVSDWDGYRDLVRDGIDGFRVPTRAPRPGLAGDMAFRFANRWEDYDHYVGMTSQFVAVDVDAAADALLALFDNPDLRARMAAAAVERARAVFDWRTVIGQYQALWAELEAVRKAAPPRPPGPPSPWRPDPFALFAGYPTEALGADAVVALAPGATAAVAAAMRDHPSVRYVNWAILTPEELKAAFALLEANGPTPVPALVAAFPSARRGVAERSILWLAKFGMATLSPPGRARNTLVRSLSSGRPLAGPGGRAQDEGD